MSAQDAWKPVPPLTEEERNKRDYPSVDLAYNLAVQSYDTAHKRWEAADNRVQTLLTFTVTVELALPTLLHSNVPQTRFNSLWFVCAVIAYVFSVGIGTYMRLKRGLILIDPKKLYNKWLGFSEWEFKKDFIYWAGEDYEINNKNINRKITYTVGMLILFLIGDLLLIIWVIRAPA
jgi:hypothetical protein